jgi:hypothetical protein
MINLIEIKLAILLPMLGATFVSQAQEGLLVFKYMDCGVKTIHLSRTERLDYTYYDGVIVEKQDLSLDGIVERYYFYHEIGKVDSIVYYEINEDTTYVSRDYYRYTYDESRIKTVEVIEDVEDGKITLDSFLYRPDGLVDQVYHFENKVESILGTVRTTKLLLLENIKYEYDDSLALSLAYNKGDSNGREFTHEYDDSGLVIKTVEYLGYTRTGCVAGEDNRYCHTSYSYNKLGLPLRQVHRFSLVKPDGKLRTNGRVSFNRRKYEYYR